MQGRRPDAVVFFFFNGCQWRKRKVAIIFNMFAIKHSFWIDLFLVYTGVF